MGAISASLYKVYRAGCLPDVFERKLFSLSNDQHDILNRYFRINAVDAMESDAIPQPVFCREK